MKTVYLGAIATGILIVLGVLILSPAFSRFGEQAPKLTTMLSFSIVDDSNTPEWCNGLSSILEKHDVKATVFVTGRIADLYEECVSAFSENSKVDIGSQTYSYVELPSIADYAIQLEEIRKGKQAVDDAGSISSRVFKAPYGSTDENIYSLLRRSNITADFSYDQKYNKYHNGQFIWFNITSYDGRAYSANFFHTLPVTDTPTLISFDNSVPIEQIDGFISELKNGNIRLANASDLTALDLTLREGELIG